MNAPAQGEARGFAATFVVVLAVLLLSGGVAHAQNNGGVSSAARAAVGSTLSGQVLDATYLMAPTDLNTDWRIQAGDNPAWAKADFDDSHWVAFDTSKDLKSYFPRNHPQIVWYRLHVKVSPNETGLALRQYSLAHASDVYANGERLIAVGRISPVALSTYNAPVVRRIPQNMLASGMLVIAARVYISPSEWAPENQPGLSAGNLALGEESTLQRDDMLKVIGQNSVLWLDQLMSIGLGVVALVLFAAQRRQKEYLWIAALGLIALGQVIEPTVAAFRNIPLRWEMIGHIPLLFSPYVLTSLYFAFIGKRAGWGWRIFFAFAGVLNAAPAQNIYFGLPVSLQIFVNLPFIVLLSVIIPAMLTTHWRRGNREAGILLIPAVLFSLYIYTQVVFGLLLQLPAWHDLAIRVLQLINQLPVGPFSFSLDLVSDMLSTVSLAVILLLRSASVSRRQAILEGELAAAQEVQQVLLPEGIAAVPGFSVESVYLPAQQVGGDFFQILPSGDGGLLVVVGDVAGKGLSAAMLVSVLVGAIRGVAEYTHKPVELLRSLNERLVGRGGGSFSTALVAHITASGAVTIANAGHLSPYLDGREVALPGALPLGVVSGAEYETTECTLAAGSRLTFYSDGVVEAQNARGEMFGFDRAMEISTKPAAAIVETVRQFGQEDDITVVTITRQAEIATAT